MAKLHSMTGYGRASGNTSLGELEVEVRSVNHRSLDLNFRGSRELTDVEPRVRDLVRDELVRGRVDVLLNLARRGRPNRRVVVDEEVAARYKVLSDNLIVRLNLEGKISIDTLMMLPDVIYQEEVEIDEAKRWEETEPIFRKALDGLIRMRAKEGRELAKDLRTQLRELAGELKVVKKHLATETERWRETLKKRIEDLMADGRELDPGRLEQEVAVAVSRGDIQEEVVRLESHLQQFKTKLSEGGSVGRQFDFLCQEMHREVNTIGSKASSLQITNSVIRMKGFVEKVREQVQNLQ